METRTLHLLFFFLLDVCICYLILKKKNVLSLFHRKKKRRKKVRSGKKSPFRMHQQCNFSQSNRSYTQASHCLSRVQESSAFILLLRRKSPTIRRIVETARASASRQPEQRSQRNPLPPSPPLPVPAPAQQPSAEAAHTPPP